MRICSFLVLLLAMAGCDRSPAAPVLRDPHRFDCVVDGDCVNTCGYGAVNAGWVARADKEPGFLACKDGCANQLAAPPRCEAGSCVAYQRDPSNAGLVSRVPGCTRKER